MSRELAEKLKAHYDTLGPDRVRNTELVLVTFVSPRKSERFYGVRYLWVGHYEAGMRCVQDGEHQSGEEYSEVRIALVGARPVFLTKHGRAPFYESKYVVRFAGDDGDWYVSHYQPNDLVNEFAPVGKEFTLGRWPHEKETHGRIDKYDPKPRERRAATLTVLEDSHD